MCEKVIEMADEAAAHTANHDDVPPVTKPYDKKYYG